MIKHKIVNPQDFEKLLNWLDPDRETAGQKYESIRYRLIKIFNARGCSIAEELADKTIDRVTQKIDGIIDVYEGNPAIYFYAVGKKILLEHFKIPKTEELDPRIPDKKKDIEEETDTQKCLKVCLQKLDEEDRNLIIQYYQKDKREKIENRRYLAQMQGFTNELLRIHVYRIRHKLEKCINNCLNKL